MRTFLISVALFWIMPVAMAQTNLSVTKSVSPDPSQQGDDISFTLIVANNGDQDSPNTVVVDLFPEGPSVFNVYVDGELLPFSEWDSEYIGNQERITVNLGTVPAGETREVTINAFNGASNGQILTNVATVSGDLEDPDSSDNTDQVDFQVGSVATDLVVYKFSSAETINAGKEVIYTIVVDNTSMAGGGPADSPNTLFFDQLPEGLVFRSATASNGVQINYNASEESLSADLGTIAAGEIVTIKVVAKAEIPGQWTNEARALGDAEELDLSNNEATSSLEIEEPVPPSVDGGINDGSPGYAADPVLTSTGEYYFVTEPDLEVNGPIDLTLRRTYNSSFSRNRVTSRMGANWRHSYDWQLDIYTSGIYIFNPLGQILHFTEENPGAWVQQTNLHEPFQLIDESGDYYLFDPRERQVYQFGIPDGFDDYRFVAIQEARGTGLMLDYNDAGRLVRVSDGLGRELSFAYTTEGRLASATDGQRTVNYNYTDSLLTGYTDAGGFETTYAYTEAGGFAGLLLAETLPEGNQPVSQTWDDLGRVATQTTGTGHSTNFEYTAEQTTVTDPAGMTTVHVHNADGNLLEVTDAAGRTADLSLDGAGRRTGIIRESGASRQETFHPDSGLLASETHAEGGSIYYRYVAIPLESGFEQFEIDQVRFPDGTSREYTYDGRGNRLSMTDRNGGTTFYEYDDIGKITSITNPLGGETTMVYDAMGNLTSMTDDSGNTTSYSHDALSRLVTVDVPGPGLRINTYDYANRLTSVSDDTASVIDYTYDRNGNRREETNAIGTTSYLFDATDRVVGITRPSSENSAIEYDVLSRPSEIRIGNAHAVEFTFDPAGEVLSIDTSGTGKRTRTLDGEGQPDTLTDDEGRTIEYAVDNNGLTKSISFAGGNPYTFIYDDLGRVVSRTYGDGTSERLVWTGDNLLKSITQEPSGLATHFAYDAMGNLLEQRQGSASWAFLYDSQSRITETTDPLGNSIQFSYNENNRWQQVTFPDSHGTLDFSYDSSGRTLRRLYSDGTDIQTTFDAAGRKTTSENLTLAYDSENRVVQSNGILMTWEPYIHQVKTITYAPGKTVTYTYNTDGLLQSVADWTGGGLSFTYDSTGRVTSRIRNNGLASNYTYDGIGRVLDIDHGIGLINVSRDSEGRILLLDSTLPAPGVPATSEREFSYNLLNQIEDFEYDAAGRRTSDDNREYTYDLADRLLAVEGSSGSTAYTYDGNGLMVSSQSEGVETEFVWNYAFDIPVPQIVRIDEIDSWYYVNSPGLDLLYRINVESEEVQYYHFDPIGHTVALTDEQGTAIVTYSYSPFGRVFSSIAGIDNPFTFVGRYGVVHQPELDLYFMRHRVYDPLSEQFLTRDPFYLLPHPRSVGQYQYASGDPVNHVDPTGLTPVSSDVANEQVFSDGTRTVLSVVSTAMSITGDLNDTGAGELLDAAADVAHVKANRALGASLAIGHEVARTRIANLGGNAATAKYEPIAQAYADKAQKLDKLSDGLRATSKPVTALGKAGKLLGPLSLGVEGALGYGRIADSQNTTDRNIRLGWESYQARRAEVKLIAKEKKKGHEWLKKELEDLKDDFLWEAYNLNFIGTFDGVLNIWITAGDMIGTMVPGYGVLFGTEDAGNFIQQNIYN